MGLFFQKYYFGGINFDKEEKYKKDKDIVGKIKDRNNVLLQFSELNNTLFFQLQDAESKFTLKNIYPGIATGIGMKHETGIEGELKLGLYFDHSSGMPCIPGSSVKGALRSAFPQFVKHTKTNSEVKIAKAYVLNNYMLNKIDPENFPLIDKNPKESDIRKIRQLEEEIFEGKKIDTQKHDDKGEIKIFLSVYEKDIFHDAFVVIGDKKGRILGDDAITHHPNPLKNPNPVLFLKIMPGVTVQFNFDLKDGIFLKADQKADLFKLILQYYGIGAKTNVGYGQFEPTS
jgi:CRISPR-associated protein Cmr6